jgi:hypothetical protein
MYVPMQCCSRMYVTLLFRVSQSYFTTDDQSVTMSRCRALLWGPWPDFTFSFLFVWSFSFYTFTGGVCAAICRKVRAMSVIWGCMRRCVCNSFASCYWFYKCNILSRCLNICTSFLSVRHIWYPLLFRMYALCLVYGSYIRNSLHRFTDPHKITKVSNIKAITTIQNCEINKNYEYIIYYRNNGRRRKAVQVKTKIDVLEQTYFHEWTTTLENTEIF